MVFLQCSYYREEKVIHKPKTRKVIKGERLKKKKKKSASSGSWVYLKLSKATSSERCN